MIEEIAEFAVTAHDTSIIDRATRYQSMGGAKDCQEIEFGP